MTQKNRKIKKIAVLGSGVMGSQIACHFANIGLDVLLLDIAPRELNDKEKSKGFTLEDTVVKNRIVNSALVFASKMKPAPLYKKEFISRILKRKNIQSFIMLGLKVMFLRYAPAPHNKRKFKLLIPIGIPTTTSLNNPAKKIKIYPKLSLFFKL